MNKNDQQQDYDFLGALQQAGRTILDTALIGVSVAGRSIADVADSALEALKDLDKQDDAAAPKPGTEAPKAEAPRSESAPASEPRKPTAKAATPKEPTKAPKPRKPRATKPAGGKAE